MGGRMYTLHLPRNTPPPLPSCVVRTTTSGRSMHSPRSEHMLYIDKHTYILWPRLQCRKRYLVRHEQYANIPLLYRLRFSHMFFTYTIYSANTAGSIQFRPLKLRLHGYTNFLSTENKSTMAYIYFFFQYKAVML